MSRLLLVSSRLPVTIEREGGRLRFHRSVGGVATGLESLEGFQERLWVGWPGLASDGLTEGDRAEIEAGLHEQGSLPVYLTERDLQEHYYGFCNDTIWPLFHYFTQYTVFDEALWNAYVRVNERFCETVLRVARPTDRIWVHDYQLLLVPELIRRELPDVGIGFFLHIPFPSYELFRLLPWRKELLEGMIGADLIGFHTYDYVRHFLSSVRRLLGYDARFNQIFAGRRVVKADIFPMGIDYERYAGAVQTASVEGAIRDISKEVGDRRVILSIDRLDYTKGILERLEAFDLFLEKYPEYRQRVTLILVAVPSRTGVETYQELKKRIDEHIGDINGRYGTIGWVPVWYLYRSLPFEMLIALYARSDVALITPVRDGMNLIAKEFIASKNDGRGVLVLSEMAGSAQELGEAIIVNPQSKEEVADALREALEMPEREQMARNQRMQRRLRRYNIRRWAADFMDRLAQVKHVQRELGICRLTEEARDALIRDYRDSTQRLLLLDYDGTLRSFEDRPEDAQPDPSVLKLLDELTQDPYNTLVIVSGRDRHALQRWFGELNVILSAGHGAWIREGTEWRTIEPLSNAWKEELRPTFEVYVDRTPGAWLEEKDYSLVWHYRRANPELVPVRVTELREALLQITRNLNLSLLEGNKVLEVKNSGINKGRVAQHFSADAAWDFILAIGDDWTDEDMFSVLPSTAYTIKVGIFSSQARFNLDSVQEVIALIGELTAISQGSDM